MRRRPWYALGPILFLATLAVPSDLPKNTRLQVRLKQMLSSGSCLYGQKIEAILDRAVSRAGLILLPRRSLVEGVAACQGSDPVGYRPERLDIALLSIKASGKTYSILTNTITLVGTLVARDPKTGRPVDNGARKADVARAAAEIAIADTTNNIGESAPTTPSATLPLDTPEVRSGPHVTLLPGSRLTFTLFSGKSD